MAQPAAATSRALLLDMYRAAVEAAHPRTCLPPHLPALVPGRRLLVVGAGKANAAMAVATEAHYAAAGVLDWLFGGVTTRHGFELPTRHLHVDTAAHPTPDLASERAATAALSAVSAAPADVDVLVLLSGGASALWSAPVAGLTLADKQRLTRALLRSGATISEINTVRRHLSRIKGGRLAAAAGPHRRLLTLAISDVPGDRPEAIGSGPTVADATTLADARAVLERFAIDPGQAIAAALRDAANETLKPGAAVLAQAEYRIVAAPRQSLDVAAERARAAGYSVDLLGDALEGEARMVGAEHAARALAARQAGQRVAIISGGELTVTVRGQGRGGPNQEYALGLAAALAGAAGITALAADTDGIDGGSGAATDPAGALVFADTLARAAAVGREAATALADNASTDYFDAIGDLVAVGPTQTNVNDFRVILIDP
jgi:hydroxypyruvate reductase